MTQALSLVNFMRGLVDDHSRDIFQLRAGLTEQRQLEIMQADALRMHALVRFFGSLGLRYVRLDFEGRHADGEGLAILTRAAQLDGYGLSSGLCLPWEEYIDYFNDKYSKQHGFTSITHTVNPVEAPPERGTDKERVAHEWARQAYAKWQAHVLEWTTRGEQAIGKPPRL